MYPRVVLKVSRNPSEAPTPLIMNPISNDYWALVLVLVLVRLLRRILMLVPVLARVLALGDVPAADFRLRSKQRQECPYA